jgi:arylsulfatase A-like enzyme
MILASLIPEWLSRGYTFLVSSDHGINPDGSHGGTTPEVREVPLFLIQHDLQGRGNTGEIVSHLQIAPTILYLLSVPIPETMKLPPIPESRP